MLELFRFFTGSTATWPGPQRKWPAAAPGFYYRPVDCKALRRYVFAGWLAPPATRLQEPRPRLCATGVLCPRTRFSRGPARGVLRPLRVVIDNYPEDQTEQLDDINNPEKPEMGTRKVPFSRVLYIEQDDFLEDPPKKFFRLAPGREIRLRYAYFIKCVDVVKDEKTGEIIELRCTYDPETRGGNAPDGRKVKATLHWVSAAHAIEAEIRLYEHLFIKEDPIDVEDGSDFKDCINPHSVERLSDCRLEPSLAASAPGSHYQFERIGYFFVDPIESTNGSPVFNRTVTLRDTWAKIKKKKHQRN